jgi:predicted dehydrogenase
MGSRAMSRQVRFGVLGAAKIALEKVLPAMSGAAQCALVAIGSRDRDKARRAAAALGIPRAYGSYAELLADPEVDAVYIPLPNHLHVPWSIEALQRGKHVLCEKPIALSAAEAETLKQARDASGLLVEEAFMVRTHPQWLRARELVRAGRIGALRELVACFSYFNEDPANVRNVPEFGGGGLMDIGCYPITIARFLFEAEPLRVAAFLERDPRFGTDRLASAVLEFPAGQAIFTCSTQLVAYQRVQLLGTKGRIEVEIPWNAPRDAPTRLLVDDGRDVKGGGIEVVELPACDQYRIQAELFARAVLENGAVATPLEDSIRNMKVIEAAVRSAASGRAEAP